MSLDDLYSNFKIAKQEIRGTTSLKISNMDFMSSSSPNSTKEVPTIFGASTASPQVSTANLSDAIVYAFLANQPNGSQLMHEDLEQIHKDDLKEIDLKWKLALLSIRDMSKKILGYVSYNVVPPPHTGRLGANTIKVEGCECFVPSHDFKLADESHVLLKVPRKNNMYSVDKKNIVPKKNLTCLVAKATNDESMLWHRGLGYINFKNINKLVKDNLVRGLPSKRFENNQTCVACLKGKQHKVSFNFKIQNSISQPLFMLHMDLFGPTSVRSIMHKKYCLVITDDFSRFTSVFFLATKDETSRILKCFITEIENLVDNKVKIIRCDNGTQFKNRVMNEFCKEKCIKREYIVAITPQQKRNRVLVVKPHFKTPYDLFRGRTPALSFMRPFGCHVTILNTLDHLEKFDRKSDEGFFVGYSINSKAFRVYNTRTKKDNDGPDTESEIENQERPNGENNTKDINTIGPSINTANLNINTASPTVNVVRLTRIEAIRLFLAYASFMGFLVYQMDIKSAFLYGRIKEEVYVCQPPGFEDLDYPDKVYKVEKALYGLHQAPRAWYKTLAKYLLGNGFPKAKLIKPCSSRDKKIIFSLYKWLQVKQKSDGVFISQDKYVDEILRKFKYEDVKLSSTLMDKEKALLKNSDGDDVDVHLYRIPQSNVPSSAVDEAITKEMHDGLGRATTIASSLGAGQGSGNITKTRSKATPSDLSSPRSSLEGGPRCHFTIEDSLVQARLERLSNLSNEPPLGEVTHLENELTSTKAVYNKALITLTKRVKKLGKKLKHKRRAVIDSSSEEEVSLDHEDSPKQGRMIKEIDKDENVNMVKSSKKGEAHETAASPQIDDDETLAKTLLNIKRSATKDKGKAIMQESESSKKIKKKEMMQISLDEEIAQIFFEEEQAHILRDEEMLEEERKSLSIEERSRLLEKFIDKRKKMLARKKAEEKINKPPTQAQQRTYITNYLKSMGGYTLKQLKQYSFEELKMLFDNTMKSIGRFVPMKSEGQAADSKAGERSSKAGETKQEEKESSKKAGGRLKRKTSKAKEDKDKRQKKQDDPEKLTLMEADGSYKTYIFFSEMLNDFEKEDLIVLYRLFNEKYASIRPGFDDLMLCGDMKIMFEPNGDAKV
uniref:Putative ribonuclease H-like domain-containing protein n=1 Tax=Tanacetum cinerariifolium TaxID=118510 RepID=A0A6L2MVI2_TANCI|nr:putative ribonuclease H-like domain-containing protein [Tanacetum cinerariifolium]